MISKRPRGQRLSKHGEEGGDNKNADNMNADRCVFKPIVSLDELVFFPFADREIDGDVRPGPS